MPSAHTHDAAVLQPAAKPATPDSKDRSDLETVELELAIDRQTLQEFGFEHCLQQACEASGFGFLFQLPIFDQIPGQRIAVLTTRDGSKLLFAVLNDAGDDIAIVSEEEMRPEIRSFSTAFMEVFMHLGNSPARD
ncbi:hypothetical protein [Oricola thermophila]|uniref:Uncharacterized protein n=1 Tax=Oricola thermophila TaxID=2742145 RepID=A0A6N1VHK6_9HYPH|nr:hypothetical protein [Oricola thermophila]QKV18792.1 hypothetical protein HTY61_10190 [Oricola thermophila]